VVNAVKKRLLKTASKHCANWNSGDCLGCMIKTEKKVIIFKIKSKLANKPCVINTGCEYFNNIVLPGLNYGT